MPKVKHDVGPVTVGKRWQAQCSCNWKGKLHNIKLSASNEARDHRKATQ